MAVQLAHKREEKFAADTTGAMNADDVATFLLQNKDFFRNYEHVLVEMDFSSTLNGNVTSIYDFQLRKVRRKLDQVEEKNRLLVQTALQNMQTENQIHELVVHLMKATSLEDLYTLLQSELKIGLNLDFIDVLPTTGHNWSHHAAPLDAAYIDSFFNTQTNVKLRTVCDGVDVAMYGEAGAAIASDALLRLHSEQHGTIGLLMMGSFNRARFHAGQASDLLEFVAQVFALCVERLAR